MNTTESTNTNIFNIQIACSMLNLFDHIFKHGDVFIVIDGNETTEQDKNNKISPKL